MPKNPSKGGPKIYIWNYTKNAFSGFSKQFRDHMDEVDLFC